MDLFLMISGAVFVSLDAPGDTFGCLGQSLGTFFGIWRAPWGTFSDLGGSLGDLVAPNEFQNRLFWILDAFWAQFWEAFCNQYHEKRLFKIG